MLRVAGLCPESARWPRHYQLNPYPLAAGGAQTANTAVEGRPTERHAAYYTERAIGIAAMIVVEPMPVHLRPF